MTVCHSTFASL